MSRKNIKMRVFTQEQGIKPKVLKGCPFYDASTGCEFDIDEDDECRYFKGNSIPASCPMQEGSITLIYYVED